MQKEVLIIIPAYNEEKNISKVLDRLEQPEIAEFADILVMNDASSDNTNWIVKARHHAVVTHVFNLGYGSALHDAGNLINLYRALKTPDENGVYPDIVLGSRYLNDSPYFETSALKRFAFFLFRHIIKWSTGRTIMDPTTGLQGLSRRAALCYSKFGNFDEKYPDANMITNMLLSDFNIVEIPAVMHLREHGKSMHSGLKPIGYMFHMFFSILAVLIRQKIFKNVPKAERYNNDIQKTQ